MNNNYNFNTIMGLDNETTPETSEKKEVSTFQKVVITAAGVGVIAGAALVTMKTMDHAVGEIKAGVTSFKDARKKAEDEKDSVKAKQMRAFTQKLRDEGYSDEEALELTKAEYGLKG